MTKKLKKKEQDRHLLFRNIAMVYGYNDLARQHDRLGDKVYFRIMRDMASAEMERLGGQPILQQDGKTILKLGTRPPFIEFTERDIELMRAAVAEYDGRKL